MCHSCASRNPGSFVPAPVGLVGHRELWDTFWIPACAGMTTKVSPLSGREELLHSAKVLPITEAPRRPDRARRSV